MSVEVSGFGGGARLFQLQAHGLRAAVSDFGAALVSLHHQDGPNVVLGLDSNAAYAADSQFMGVIAGRCANRIALGRFQLDGKSWHLACNDGKHHLHGGVEGFGKRLWRTDIDSSQTAVRFALTSPHLDQGYPGRLEVFATYRITPEGRLRLSLEARADRPALVNLTPHSYFNLTERGQVGDHRLQLHASHYTPVDGELIPTGEISPVDGTGFDYLTPRPFDQNLDINFAVDGAAGTLRPVADVWDPASGRQLSVQATAPGLQVYGGAHLGPGGVFPAHAGFCLEPQYFPDSPNQPRFPAPIADPDHPYGEVVEYALNTCNCTIDPS